MKKKHYLNSQQQLEKLLKEKKIVLDIPKIEAVEFLESKNYTRAVTPFKDLLVDYNFDNTQPIKTLNKRILREYNQGLRVPIDVSGKIEKNIILKHLKDYKTQKHRYEKPINFTQIQQYTETSEEMSTEVYKKFLSIEPTIKTILADFIGSRCNEIKWFDWLLSKVQDDKVEKLTNILNSVYDEIMKNKYKMIGEYRYKYLSLEIWSVINSMTLGQVKEILNLIMYSKLDKYIKQKFLKRLFVDKLNKIVEMNENNQITYKFLVSKLISLVDLRNSTMHIQPISSFFLYERLMQIKIEKKSTNIRFWFVKNNFKDKTVAYFLNNYDALSNINVNSISKDFIFNNLKLGYFIEMEEIDTGNKYSLDLKILEVFDWWFKDIK